MEDAATAEISRSQIWQWVRHAATLADGRAVTAELVREVLDEETAKIRAEVGEETWQAGAPSRRASSSSASRWRSSSPSS